MYEEIMTNDDNLESNLLTSSLLKMLVQVLLQVEPAICVEVMCAQLESYWYLYEQGQVNYSAGLDSIGYYSLHGSIMDCSLMVTRAGVAGQECEYWITHHLPIRYI